MDNLITLGGALLVLLGIVLSGYLLGIVIMLGIKVYDLLNNFMEWLSKKLFGDRR